MRDVCVVLAVLLASFIVAPEVASACTFEPHPPHLIWPVANEGDPYNYEPSPAFLDTQVWLMIPHFGLDWSAALRDEDGEIVSTKLEVFHSEIGYFDEYNSLAILSPVMALKPEQNYTVEVVIVVPEAAEPSVSEMMFSTGDSESTIDASTLDVRGFYALDGQQPANDCGFDGAIRQFSVHVYDDIKARPFFYKLELDFPDGKKLENSFFARTRGDGALSSMFPTVWLRSEAEMPCATLIRRDVHGNEDRASSCDWRCGTWQRGWYDLLREGEFDDWTSCDFPNSSVDMGQGGMDDMGTPTDMGLSGAAMEEEGVLDLGSPDAMEPADMSGLGEGDATCAGVANPRPASPWLVCIGVLFISLRRKKGVRVMAR
jgi:hypothetical protein